MRTVVLGAGALGSIIAAHLARAHKDVALLARGERAKLIKQHGLTIHGLSEFTTAVEVIEDPHVLQAADLLIVTVKTYDTEQALAGVAHVDVGSALSVQNGLIKDEQIAAVFGSKATLGASADFSGEVNSDGSVSFTRNEGFFIGELPNGVSGRVEEIVAEIGSSGVKAIASDHIQGIEWSKYVGWLGLTPVALMSRLETHRILQDADLAYLQVRLTREAAALAAHFNVELDDAIAVAGARTLGTGSIADAVEHQRQIGAAMEGRGMTNHKMSALQDLERGRRLEVEETLGHAVRMARESGVSLPALELCYGFVRGLDHTLRQT